MSDHFFPALDAAVNVITDVDSEARAGPTVAVTKSVIDTLRKTIDDLRTSAPRRDHLFEEVGKYAKERYGEDVAEDAAADAVLHLWEFPHRYSALTDPQCSQALARRAQNRGGAMQVSDARRKEREINHVRKLAAHGDDGQSTDQIERLDAITPRLAESHRVAIQRARYGKTAKHVEQEYGVRARTARQRKTRATREARRLLGEGFSAPRFVNDLRGIGSGGCPRSLHAMISWEM
jgi:hypothetical protein